MGFCSAAIYRPFPSLPPSHHSAPRPRTHPNETRPHRNEFGPDIGYRESSFLNHPGLPDIVRGSVVQVHSCRSGEVGCSAGDNPATVEFNRLSLHEHMDSNRILMWVGGGDG